MILKSNQAICLIWTDGLIFYQQQRKKLPPPHREQQTLARHKLVHSRSLEGMDISFPVV